jgi:hypothetical protein
VHPPRCAYKNSARGVVSWYQDLCARAPCEYLYGKSCPRSAPFSASYFLYILVESLSLIPSFVLLHLLSWGFSPICQALQRSFIPAFRWQSIMQSAQMARVRPSPDVSHTSHNSPAAADISTRDILKCYIEDLVTRNPNLLEDGALDDTQLHTFTAAFRKLINNNEMVLHSRRHRKSDVTITSVWTNLADARIAANSISFQGSNAHSSSSSTFTRDQASRVTSAATSHGSYRSAITSPTAISPDTPALDVMEAIPSQLTGVYRCTICFRETRPTDPDPSPASIASLKRQHAEHGLRWLYQEWRTSAVESILKDCALEHVINPVDLLLGLLNIMRTRNELPHYLHLAFANLLTHNSELRTLASMYNISQRPVQASVEKPTKTEANKLIEATRAILHCLEQFHGRSTWSDAPMPRKRQVRDSITVARNRQLASNTTGRLPQLQERNPNSQPLAPVASMPAVPKIMARNSTHPAPASGAGVPTVSNDNTDTNGTSAVDEWLRNNNMPMDVDWTSFMTMTP